MGPSVEDAELMDVFPLRLGVVGQNTAMDVLPTARNFFLVLISTIPVHSSSFCPNPLPTF